MSIAPNPFFFFSKVEFPAGFILPRRRPKPRFRDLDDPVRSPGVGFFAAFPPLGRSHHPFSTLFVVGHPPFGLNYSCRTDFEVGAGCFRCAPGSPPSRKKGTDPRTRLKIESLRATGLTNCRRPRRFEVMDEHELWLV